MEVRVLGPVEIWDCDKTVDVGPIQQRIVLAVLAANASRPVSAEALIDRVWGEQPPAKARDALYTYISRLRRLLGSRQSAAGAPEVEGVQVLRRADGYLLDMEAELIDLHRFRQLVARARVEESSEVDRAKLLREALDTWSETPLAGLPGQWVARARGSWEHERLDAATRWAALELRLGRPLDVIAPLRELLWDHPVAEPLAAVLMRALAMAGREAEALDYYASLRTQLADTLGVEPGSQLRAVHQALLRDEL
ncbi:hypothetical protein DY218_31030 [Streptomyces triticagri]|uniref:OmpR/PhoB-type domain-containing protein n=1 Tax=Streptomyces triticagri TaxID=2293568 RepID=A0A372LWY4_9ACTN|nr:AfsR/SARP family transcriptional regulator [Streptomyces triticagri]RFU82783.1 hypothetical protein DY218_31030 [Streptomyces triticagri]